MAIAIKRTGSLAATNGVKFLVYGQAGSGKTSLIRTLPAPLVLSAEAGLLSIQDADIPFIEIKTFNDLEEVYQWLTLSQEAAEFQSIALDSISEVAEVVLANQKRILKDGRQAYGEMNDQVSDIVRRFRDLPGKHVYFSAKVEKMKDETGRLLYSPSTPGERLKQGLPYFFDEVFAMRAEKDTEGRVNRGLMCDTDGLWLAKDRSGKLDQWEAPDLGAIIAKMTAPAQPQAAAQEVGQ